MNWEERQEMISKEPLGLRETGKIEITKEDKNRGSKGLIS